MMTKQDTLKTKKPLTVCTHVPAAMFQTPLTSPVTAGGSGSIVLPPNPIRPFLSACPNPLIQTSINHGYYTPLGYGYQPPTSPSPVPSSTNQLPQVRYLTRSDVFLKYPRASQCQSFFFFLLLFF